MNAKQTPNVEERVGFGKRLAAWLLDMGVVCLLGIPVGLMLYVLVQLLVLVVIRLIMTDFRNIIIYQTNNKRLFYKILADGTTNIENRSSDFVKI